MRRVIQTRIGRRRISRDVDDELAFHLDMRADQLMRTEGLSPEEARAEAARRFGDMPGVRDACVTLDHGRIRIMDRRNVLQDLRQDLTYAARMLRRTPAVSLVVVLTLALGIGANTAIFTLVNAVLLQKLPVTAPDELVIVGDPTRTGSMGFDTSPRADLFTYRGYQRLAEMSAAAVSGLAATGRVDRLEFAAGDRSGTERPRARMVSGNYFELLGIPAQLGRTLHRGEDDAIGGAPVVVISHGYWQRRFGGDSAVVGRDVLLNGARFTVAGITTPGFTGEIVGQETDLWIPLAMQQVLAPRRPLLGDDQAYWLLLIGRRERGVSFEQARTVLADAVRRVAEERFAGTPLSREAASLDVQVSGGARGLSRVRTTYRTPLLILMAGVALLLLIICANVANILMARAIARVREMSVRLAIGAGRSRLVRQLLTESLLLGLLGAGAGLVLAGWGSRLLLALAADGGPVLPLDTSLGVAACAFTLVVALATVVVFGLLPALRTSRVDVAAAMRASTRSLGGSRNPLGRLLIAAQVALSVVLLVGATLLSRSLSHVQQVDTGTARDELLIVDVDAIEGGYEGERLTTLASALAERLSVLPGVRAVSFSENGLFTGTESLVNVGIPGFAVTQREDSLAYYDQVGPGFVAATGARLLRGRDAADSDREGTPRVVLLNESFARYYFGARSPIGETIRVGDSAFAEVIGVVADVKDRTLTGPARRRFYLPYLQHPLGDAGALRFIVRASGEPAALMPSVRSAIQAQDATLSIFSMAPLSQLMRQSIREERLLARLATVFGGAALLLAVVGLYGVISYAVSRRSGEIGLRVALGAQRSAVIRMIVRDGLVLVAIGAAAGVPLTLAASQVIRGQLHGVAPTDPVAYGLAFSILVAGAVASALLPALRVSRVAPVVALRAE